MRWFTRGDLDGFFGLAIDNLVQLLLIDALCRFVLGFPDQLLHERVLPGVAVSMVLGNLFYAWQARRLARRERRSDVCALPYGINTLSLIAYVFLVMAPAKALAEREGLADPAGFAWRAGLLACLGSGVIELLGALVADRVRRSTPRAALLSTLAGIALAFLTLGFHLRVFARPVVGIVTLGILLLTYFGKVRFRGGLPGGLVAVAVGAGLAWATGLAGLGERPPLAGPHAPILALQDLRTAWHADVLLRYLYVIVPMGLFNLLGSLQNLESAAAAGDHYSNRSSLAVNGLGTLAAAAFGSCFPTTIYIGHPGWKAMGAGAGYSVLNALFVTAVCTFGATGWIAWFVPVDAGMAIVLWIGLIITAQAFQATPSAHAPAVVLGLLPGLAAWAAVLAKNVLRAAGIGTPERPLDAAREDLVRTLEHSDTWIEGAFALEQGALFAAMLWAALAVAVIERRFVRAALWSAIAAALSLTGLIHSFEWSTTDTVMTLRPAWRWAVGYGVLAALLVAAPWLTRPVVTAEGAAGSTRSELPP